MYSTSTDRVTWYCFDRSDFRSLNEACLYVEAHVSFTSLASYMCTYIQYVSTCNVSFSSLSFLCVNCLYVHRFWMERSTLWHLCGQEGNSACCDYSVKYGCIHCNCISSDALTDTFYIICNFMDILIATNYLCLGLLQCSSLLCLCFYFDHAFLATAVRMQHNIVGNIYVKGCIYTRITLCCADIMYRFVSQVNRWGTVSNRFVVAGRC